MKYNLHEYSKPEVYLNAIELKISNSMLYLGVQLDSKLIWKSHINQFKAKSVRLVMNLFGFAKKNLLDSIESH